MNAKLAVLVILSVLAVAACTKPADDAIRAQITDDSNVQVVGQGEQVTEGTTNDYEKVPINKEKSNFEFEGYAPGKSHVGTFDEFDGFLYVKDGKLVGGEGTAHVASVNTGISGLDKHLLSDDFFDVEKYPTITFKSTKLSKDGRTLTGDLTFRGTTKEILIPTNITENSASTDFILDTTPFGMKYIGVNKEVRIAFNFVR